MNLRSKGKDNGTYIRVAGTSRQAFPEKIKELEMEGARISWDELTCVGYPVSGDTTAKSSEKTRRRAGKKNIKKLKEYGILIRHGTPKSGYWEIVEKKL